MVDALSMNAFKNRLDKAIQEHIFSLKMSRTLRNNWNLEAILNLPSVENIWSKASLVKKSASICDRPIQTYSSMPKILYYTTILRDPGAERDHRSALNSMSSLLRFRWRNTERDDRTRMYSRRLTATAPLVKLIINSSEIDDRPRHIGWIVNIA
jgi:hypothetical protein